jgi:hypothetical protein
MNINLKIEAKRNLSPSQMLAFINRTDKQITLKHCYLSTLDFFDKHISITYKCIKVSKKIRKGIIK